MVERYAAGFGPGTRFHSWSMAKSVTQALLARRIQAGALAVERPAPVPEWQGPGDPRAALTLRNLLHMDSGLDNADGFGGDPADAFVARLLFSEGSRDVVAYAVAPPIVHPPGKRWAYSTATTMILAGIVSRSVGGGKAGLRRFARDELFGPIGADSALLEFDAAGNFLGGGFVWARARDWARFAYLYLRDGQWDGRRLLPEGWVDFSRTRAPAGNNGNYGGHFWLNHPPKEGQPPQILPGGPPSAFAAVGNSGQYAMIVPTHDLVLVRLGELPSFEQWADLTRALAEVVAAFPETTPEAAP
ncbi:MAG: serine hydrolase [Myxococcales bacterium]|nr:serine hydrolase [Myxococcales bacterium]